VQHAQRVLGFSCDQEAISVPARRQFRHDPFSGLNANLPIAWIAVPFVRYVDDHVGPMIQLQLAG